MNALIWHRLQEWINPGYLARSERQAAAGRHAILAVAGQDRQWLTGGARQPVLVGAETGPVLRTAGMHVDPYLGEAGRASAYSASCWPVNSCLYSGPGFRRVAVLRRPRRPAAVRQRNKRIMSPTVGRRSVYPTG